MCVIILSIACLCSIFIVVNFYAGIPTGDSMEPTIQDGDLVLYEKVDSIDDVESGDIIHFTSQCSLKQDTNNIVHRVIDETEYGLITTGDNTTRADQLYDYDGNLSHHTECESPVTDKTINGKVVFNTSNDYIRDVFYTLFA